MYDIEGNLDIEASSTKVATIAGINDIVVDRVEVDEFENSAIGITSSVSNICDVTPKEVMFVLAVDKVAVDGNDISNQGVHGINVGANFLIRRVAVGI